MKAGRGLGCGVVLLSALVGFWGCADNPPTALVEAVEAHRMSPPLLLSEVQQAAEPASLLDADFALVNRTSSPQPVSLTGKSCSCYGVMHDSEPWETGATITLAPGAQSLLAFDVKPPVEPGEKSWSVRLASGVSPSSNDSSHSEQVLTLGVRVYDDLTLQPETLFARIPTATPPTATPPPSTFTTATKATSPGRGGATAAEPSATTARHAAAVGNSARPRLVIRRIWRRRGSAAVAPQISGLPAWAVASAPVAIDAPQEIAPGLWQQSWETQIEFDFNRPNSSRTTARESVAALSAGQNHEPARALEKAAATDADDARASPLATVRPATVRPGVFRFQAAFGNADNGSTKVTGRIVLKQSPGVVAPSVVHWGQISKGAVRKRRLVLSAGDRRAFRIESASLLEGDAPPGAGASPPSSADSASRPTPAAGVLTHRLVSPFADLTIGFGQEEPGIRQSVSLELIPLRAGRLDTTLVFATDHPLTPFLKVRLRAVVLEAAPSAAIPGGG